MGLKAVHLAFIACAIGLMLFFGIWEIKHYGETRGIWDLLWGVGSIAGSIVMAVYSKYFLRKLKDIGYL
ncbi:hypothetical protein HYR69_11335 [Candidatus Sumerlaeota bacterium]|nr:hypothetical protein [Candidatus Sumerlaeota bacterium]